MKPVVFIYADPLLAHTMTFVLGPSEALQDFRYYFVGPRRLRVGGLKIPSDRIVAINEIPGLLGKLREAPFRRFGFAPLYFRKLRKYRPSLLHVHGGPAGLPALRLAEWLQIPQVTTFHGFDATATNPYVTHPCYGNWDYMRRKHILMEKGDLFIAVSNFIKDKLLDQGFPERKVIVHYTGVDTDFFRPDPAIKRGLTVIFVGTLHDGKGCEYAIRAMAEVQSQLAEAELVIIGDGPLKAELQQLAREKLRRYRFLGIQPPEVVRQWMNRAKVFSTPSVKAKSGWTEAFGMVFAEAQAMCLPVASFNSGGIPEVVADGETGFLAPEGNVEALAHHLRLILEGPQLFIRMGEAGRRRVCARFDLRRQTERLEKLYMHVLGMKVDRTGPQRGTEHQREQPFAALDSRT